MRKLWAVAVPQLFLIFINLWPKKDDYLYGTKYMYSLTRRCRFCATSTYKIGLMTYDQQMNNASGPKTRKSTKYRTDGRWSIYETAVPRRSYPEAGRSQILWFLYHVSLITASRITVSQITAICISNFEASPPWLVVGDWCFRRTSKLYKNDHVIEDDDDYRNRLGSMEANNRGNDSDTAMPPSSSTAISWATSKPVWLLDNVNTL